ncbi:MAG: hypothetical protein LBL24_01335 [Bacteroidales bacterium]|jgi:hypothetical protein|nr:hypothetical protein [Bacteroidales bacterium]
MIKLHDDAVDFNPSATDYSNAPETEEQADKNRIADAKQNGKKYNLFFDEVQHQKEQKRIEY